MDLGRIEQLLDKYKKILEKVEYKHLTPIITFFDFKNEFDSIHRGNMIKVYIIPVKIISAINIIYDNTRDKVNTPNGKTEDFDIVAGVLNTLAPYLFIILLDYSFRKSVNGRKLVFYHCSSNKTNT